MFKEFRLEEYYLKIKNLNEKINIMIYNIEKLDGIKYELNLYLNDIYILSDLFRCRTKIELIYEDLINLIKENKFKKKTKKII